MIKIGLIRRRNACPMRDRRRNLRLSAYLLASVMGALSPVAVPPAMAADQAPVKPALPPGYGEVQVVVLGVTAPFFTFGLVKRFEQIPGVEHASFNLKRGTADVIVKPGATVTDDDLRHAVRNASFSIGSIHWIAHPSAKAVEN